MPSEQMLGDPRLGGKGRVVMGRKVGGYSEVAVGLRTQRRKGRRGTKGRGRLQMLRGPGVDETGVM